MVDWGKIKSFLWGGVLGGLIGLVFAPRRRVPVVNPSLWHAGEPHAFSSAPCYREDEDFT